jgi:hypothetical protein
VGKAKAIGSLKKLNELLAKNNYRSRIFPSEEKIS